MPRRLDHRIAMIAARQGGLFSRKQAQAAGMSTSAIGRRTAAGSWHVAVPGVYSLADWPDAYERRLWLGVLALPGAVVSRRSAAGLHRIPGVSARTPTVTVPKGTTHQDLPGVRVHETRRLRPFDQTTIDTFPTTTPERTIIDLAAEIRYHRLAHVIDQAVQSDVVERESLRAAMTSITRRGRTGMRSLWRYFEYRGDTPAVPTSELEYLFDRIVAQADLPPADKQYRPPWYDGIRGIVDRCWPQHRLIVELDGRGFHSTMQAFTDDRRRDRVAQRAGFRVLRYTSAELRHRAEEVVDDLRTVMARAEVA